MINSITEWESRIGASALAEFLNSFSCPQNREVEDFLKQKALQSARLSASQTYLVVDDKTCELLGYYTLVLKAYAVDGSKLNSANRRLISRFAEADETGNFHAAVYLIAQIGKNFSCDHGNRITGAKLMGMALDELRAIKRRIGGKLVMVEREADQPKLLKFYSENGFKSWTIRDDSKDGVRYDQMFAVVG